MSIRKSVIGVLLLCLVIPAASAGALQGERVSAVLELFTSQGCASCPPADELLEEYAKRPDIVSLSFSVDYWDYQGWKDTLATHEFTERQKAYAAARGDRQIYTPQMVVNGRSHVIGSDETAVNDALEAGPALSVPITIGKTSDAFSVSVGADAVDNPRKATLWLVLYERHVRVPVDRGENGSKTLDYYNVVRKMRPIAMWRGEPIQVDLPMGEYHQSKADGCAVLLQEEGLDGVPGPILGAAHIEHKDSW
ncbi:DUF1223 domain-containing protein [Kaistia dalseonensis]|uniref:DUF1223 domain-containing protein n=1 Tax=Kaistia dalseonensis TaxID=410840 RepID=A0ABU0H4L2_9HYPH|nr:DUF1223 domain-containing protein [Kaistia dalseonensis]MCX5494663.1 DUF1223 domain-containing protein [Kaistia dalseonensis]MDQ0437244.1 hypothetical protein [Kaistia dalseonensis]